MRGILERLKSGEILVGDGATGTMLLADGLDPGACLERLNLDQPERLEKSAEKLAPTIFVAISTTIR